MLNDLAKAMKALDGKKTCPTISFYTKAGESSQEPDALIALVLVDSKTGYLGCVPMNSKAQFDLATKEVIAFFRTLAYNDVMLRCDNEPSVLQLQRLVVQARQQMWLWTQACTPSAYEYGNALAENAIQRIRVLAGSLMHGLQTKLAVTVSSSHALWSWCMRHAAWILNWYNLHQGLTAYEVVYSRSSAVLVSFWKICQGNAKGQKHGIGISERFSVSRWVSTFVLNNRA